MRKPFYRLNVILKNGNTYYFSNGEIESMEGFMIVFNYEDEEVCEYAFNLDEVTYFKISPLMSVVK